MLATMQSLPQTDLNQLHCVIIRLASRKYKEEEVVIRQELYKAVIRTGKWRDRKEKVSFSPSVPSNLHQYWRRQSHFRAMTRNQCWRGGGGWGGGSGGEVQKIGEDKMECQTRLHYYLLFMDQTQAGLVLWDWLSSDWTSRRMERRIQKQRENKGGEYKDAWSFTWTCFSIWFCMLCFLGLQGRLLYLFACFWKGGISKTIQQIPMTFGVHLGHVLRYKWYDFDNFLWKT